MTAVEAPGERSSPALPWILGIAFSSPALFISAVGLFQELVVNRAAAGDVWLGLLLASCFLVVAVLILGAALVFHRHLSKPLLQKGLLVAMADSIIIGFFFVTLTLFVWVERFASNGPRDPDLLSLPSHFAAVVAGAWAALAAYLSLMFSLMTWVHGRRMKRLGGPPPAP